MTKIYVIRHAEAEGNLYRRMHGHYDGLIVPNGYRQIEALEHRFSSVHIDACYSSDLRRTMKTAEAIYKPKGLELITNPALREISIGGWEDMPFGYLERLPNGELNKFNNFPFEFVGDGAETFHQVCERMTGIITEIARENDGKTVAVFTHGCVIRALIYALFGNGDGDMSLAGHSDNTAVTYFDYEDGFFKKGYFNDNSHLDESISTLAHQHWWRGEKDKDHNMWFKPVGTDSETYIEYRKDAWELVFGSLKGFDGPGFLSDARRTTGGDPNALAYGMIGTNVAGMIQLHPARDKEFSAGYIPFLYLREQYRNNGLGVQLIGYAASYFRKLDRKSLRLRVSPNNGRAVRMYERYGFYKIGEESGKSGRTWLMEMRMD